VPSVCSLRTALLAALNRVNCLFDRALQKLKSATDNHFSVTITLPFVIEFLSYIGVGVGSLATGFRLRTEQRSCWQRNWHPFGGANCLIDRALQKLKPVAGNHFSMTITLPFVIENRLAPDALSIFHDSCSAAKLLSPALY
jgi:hypothetical protein